MADEDQSSTPKLHLLSTWRSPEHPGKLTPPRRTLASVPFVWEEEPGKPRPITTLVPLPERRSLDLPPRLLVPEPANMNFKNSSPVTVLDGPYVGRPKFISVSFREQRRRQGSFDSSSPDDGGRSRAVVVGGGGRKGRGVLFGSWRRKSSKEMIRKEIGSSSFVYPSSMEISEIISETRMVSNVDLRRNVGTLSQVKSRFWAAVYEGIKQVIPWKSRNSRR